ncbi:ABC transporter substrate-binding protein, partial [Rhizobium ruizarguesonis]
MAPIDSCGAIILDDHYWTLDRLLSTIPAATTQKARQAMGTKQSGILLSAIMTAILSTPLRAETLVVNSYGGPYEEIIEKA